MLRSLRLLARRSSWSAAPPSPRAPSHRPSPGPRPGVARQLGDRPQQDLGHRLPDRAGSRPSTPRTTPGRSSPGGATPRRRRPLGAVTQFDGTFDPGGEGGLMGIALSPGFNAGQRPAGRSSATRPRPTTGWSRFDLNLLAAPVHRHQQLDADRHRPPARRLPQRLPGAVPARHRRAVREHGRRRERRPRRSRPPCWAARSSASTRTASPWPGNVSGHALVHPRPPQPAGPGVPARVERPVLGRARPRRQRRGQQARQRREQRVEPGQRRRRLRPVEADDRLRRSSPPTR